MSAAGQVLALTGGIGGAKLVLGLQRVMRPGTLTVAVNTGDDFEHMGLAISPDVDTTLYTLAELADPERGWGRAQETWSFMQEIERLGGEIWFRLGDKDLAVHIERTRRLAQGERLESITEDFGRRLRLTTQVLPMTNDRVRTVVDTQEGPLGFQDYFVRRQCAPIVTAIGYEGAESASVIARAKALVRRADLMAIVICPSNPYLSVGPILAMPEWRALLAAARSPVVAVSPLIGNRAIKGPTVKIMRELGYDASPVTVARHYGELIDGFVLDHADAALAREISVPTHLASTLMLTLDAKECLAREVLNFAHSLRRPQCMSAS
jgi:LPPG:FO 2-phospho-L-lactate transferase